MQYEITLNIKYRNIIVFKNESKCRTTIILI